MFICPCVEKEEKLGSNAFHYIQIDIWAIF